MKNKILYVITGVIAIIIILFMFIKLNEFINEVNKISYEINLTSLKDGNGEDLKIYTISDFDKFLTDYQNNNLPDIYVTKFLFDGVGMYKTYDLDDFIEGGNDLEVETFEITNININSSGNYKLSGEITGGMISVNTNNVNKDINIILNNVRIDTDSKKVPAVYVYNKDITYTKSKVTISALENTKNYIEGGKLKKVSLIPSDNLSSYESYYNGDNKTNYNTYTNYYGIYKENEINNILFAKITADNEDLQDADPYFYYKASGAISSDIDLYFEGKGYLEVTSKNKEGIETKGNLEFSGGIGDYVINSEDDCLNTTTSSSEIQNARNTLTINVNSLYAIVSNEADEGDAIDSNGQLVIDGGLIVAIAKTGQDAGIDSENGIYINGGTVLATGDMYDEIKNSSKQNFMVLSFSQKPSSDDLITLLDSNDNVIFSFKTDREFTNLVYSSNTLKEGTYSLYLNGTIDGDNTFGYYTKVNSYEKGNIYGYSKTGMIQNDNMVKPDNNNMPNNSDMTPPEKPNGNMPNNGDMTPPEKPNGNMPDDSNISSFNGNNNDNASNKDFTISGISNLYNGVAKYSN